MKLSYVAAESSGAEIRESTIGDLIRTAAASAPEHPALTFATTADGIVGRWTYAEFLAEAEAAARALLAHFHPGERVAIWASNRPEWLFVQFGAALAGIVLVTVNPAFRAFEAGHVLRRARLAGIVVERASRGNHLRAMVDELRPALDGVRHVIDLDDWDAFVASVDPALVLPRVDPSDAVQIQFTSGTTGAPKGAVLTHRGMSNVPRIATELFELGPSPVWINAMPLFHVGGCGLSTIGPMTSLGTQVLVDRFDPELVLRLAESERATFLGGVPTMLIGLIEQPDFARRDLSSLRVVLSGGASVAPELVTHIEQALGVKFLVAFGQTEANGHVCQTRPTDTPQDKAETIGRPLPFIELSVQDPASRATVPIGAVGELCVRHPLVMAGYFDDPVATAAAIDADGWLHTGDLGALDERGQVRFAGRLKEVIVRGGENIHPREIEDVLFLHPAVGEAAVIGVPDERWGEQLAAYVRLHAGATATAEDLRGHLRALLAPQKVPVHWTFVDELPHTASGKVQKFALLERWQAGDS
ncbi:MAG TPA: AMP-binding protein [Acidimicrobiales bacterium]|nr:AMP-binding protein [Acidimicrobiales bacterium]